MGTFAGFAKNLAFAAANLSVITEGFMLEIGKKVREKAQEKIGHYQSAYKHWPEWASLSPETEATKTRKGYPADSPLIETGEYHDSIGVSPIFLGVEVGTNVKQAEYAEWGRPGQPPRPVFGPAGTEVVEEHLDEFAGVIGSAILFGSKIKVEEL